MIGSGPAPSTLFGFAAEYSADETVDRVVPGVLGRDDCSVEIFFGSIFWVAFLELELGIAFATGDNVVHLLDGLCLQFLEPLSTY